MKQPELGKKISELRKAKGLTQEELVEKCNLSVRTLIRIEAGEVMPRSYTIKTIFFALDYNFYDSSENSSNRFSKTALIISNWLEQLYRYVFDLFNLKTNTMKKLRILSIPFLIICIVIILSFNSNAKAQAKMLIREKYEKISSNSKFSALFNSGQIDSLGLLYHTKACSMQDNMPNLMNRESIIEYYKKLYDLGERFTELTELSTLINDSIAVERGTWTIIIESKKIIVKGRYLTQWHYIGGEWKIENEMSNTDKMINPEEDK